MSNREGPNEVRRPRVLKALAAPPLQAAPQTAGAVAPVGGGRFFGREDLSLYAPVFQMISPAEAAALDQGPTLSPADEAYLQALRRRAEAALAEAEGLAAEKVIDSQRQVESMLAETLAACEQIAAAAREQGHQEGFEAGYRAALEAAQEQAQQLLTAAQTEAQAALAAAEAERARLLQESRPELVRLALAVAEHLLHQELRQRPELVAGMVAAVLAQTAGERALTLRVSPADAQLLGARKGELLRRVPGLQELAVVSDSALSPGDFHLQGEHGYVSAALGEQLAIVAAALLQEESS